MAKAYLTGGDAREKSGSAADHYQVVLHSDRSALHGGVGRSDLPIETVRRLTCDGSVITLVEDENGTPLDVGRKQRTISTALRRALWARDSHCSFPGCHNRCYVDAHHIEHWADGGDTSLENLTLLCTQHHTLLHEGGFKLRRDAAGSSTSSARTGARSRVSATGSMTCATTICLRKIPPWRCASRERSTALARLRRRV